jgi:homeobox-leucine zipper protein
VRFLREHRSEWADPGVDAYSAAALRASPYAVPGLRASGFMGNQVILPLAHTLEHEEVFQVSSSSNNCLILTVNSYLFIRLTS